MQSVLKTKSKLIAQIQTRVPEIEFQLQQVSTAFSFLAIFQLVFFGIFKKFSRILSNLAVACLLSLSLSRIASSKISVAYF